MVSIRLEAVVERDRAVRAAVPITWWYQCPVHGIRERADAIAVFDSGAPRSMLPVAMLPDGHVAWDDLDPAGGMIPSLGGVRPWRYWDVELWALGVPITDRIKVWDSSFPDYPIAGMDDFARRFRITLDWGATPPAWELDPYPTALTGPAGELVEGYRKLEELPLLRYTDSWYSGVRAALNLPAVAEAVTADSLHPTLTAQPQPVAGALSAPGQETR